MCVVSMIFDTDDGCSVPFCAVLPVEKKAFGGFGPPNHHVWDFLVAQTVNTTTDVDIYHQLSASFASTVQLLN